MPATNILVGADPEAFVTVNGAVASGIGMVHGTKMFPENLGLGEVQMDNVLLEYNIPPAHNAAEFVDYNHTMIELVNQRIKSDDEDRKLLIKSSHVYDMDYLEEQGPIAMTLGCEPDQNAYTGKNNPRPDAKQGLRTAAGHIHISGEFTTPNWEAKLVRVMDAVLGLESVILDDDTARRSLYGKAGAFRLTYYGGVEYRVLSNFWLASKELTKWAYDKTIEATQLVGKRKFTKAIDERADVIQHAINTSDVGMATALLAELEEFK